MKIGLIILSFILFSCRPENKPTDYSVTIKPLSGANQQIQTPMNTPINFEYKVEKGKNAVAPKLSIAKTAKFGAIYSCTNTDLSIKCIYEPSINFVGTDSIEFITKDGDFKAEKTSKLEIVVTYVSGGEITLPGDDLPDDFDDQINNANLTCAQAIQQNKLETVNHTVSFPAAIECDFNENGTSSNQLNAAGNGPRQNGRVRARREQFVTFSLAEEGTICDMDFNFPTQVMEYDDEIFLLLNEYVLMSSTNYSDQSGDSRYDEGLKTNSLGYQTYRWLGDNSLYNLFYSQNVTPKYCLGLSMQTTSNYNEKCDIPPTETQGQMKLDIPPAEIVKLGLVSQLNYPQANTPYFKYGFVTTGDNDAGDCEHSAYSFGVTIRYAPKN